MIIIKDTEYIFNDKQHRVDEFGFIDIRKKDPSKIHTFEDTINIIDAKKKEGKIIIYLPGSYDLVHLGHLSYIDQIISGIKKHDNLIKNEDLFIFALADNDEIISNVKKSKFISGEEKQKRPVENINERMIGLSSISNLDLISYIPHTINTDKSNIKSIIKQFYENTSKNESISPTNKQKIIKAISLHSELPENELYKSIQLWQFIITMTLNKTSEPTNNKIAPFQKGKITRIVSSGDSYAEQVNHIMNNCEVAVALIDDINIISTSKIISEFNEKFDNPREEIRNYKKNIFTS